MMSRDGMEGEHRGKANRRSAGDEHAPTRSPESWTGHQNAKASK
jgi:hypothetical protein